MDCPSCGHPNPAGARFCGSCATPLTASSACPSCGASNPAGQRFCNACGQALAAEEGAHVIGEAAGVDPRAYTPEHLADKIRAGRGALEGERKQVTVLFADVMGSMELAERSDPEEWRRHAIEALERSLTISRERRAAVEGDALRLALLGESYLGLGDGERARGLVEEGLALAHARGQPALEAHARLALARVLLGSAGPAARAEIEAALARALELALGMAGKAYEPLVHVELAELARQSGDQEAHERELREAHRLFTEIGATGHAERLAGELAPA